MGLSLKSRIYTDVVERATGILLDKGRFSFGHVLADCGYAGLEDIDPAHVCKVIEERNDIELVGLAPRAFRRHSMEEERMFPNRFLAGGAGKTVGYAWPTPGNEHLVQAYWQAKILVRNGVDKSQQNTVRIAKAAGVSITQAQLPFGPVAGISESPP